MNKTSELVREKYCTCEEPELEVDVTMTEMYCEKCGKDIKKSLKNLGAE